MIQCHADGEQRRLLQLVALTAFLLGAVGCASPGSNESGTQPDVQSRSDFALAPDGQHGFIVTEDVRIVGDVRSDYQRAATLLQRDAIEEGVVVLESVIERAPGLVIPRIDLGVAHARLGNHEAAQKSFEAALALAPDHPVALNELGIVYRQTGRFAEARASYERALSIHDGFHYALLNLGVLCDLYVEDLRCALENYEAYAGIVTDDPQVGIWIADVRNRMSASQAESTP